MKACHGFLLLTYLCLISITAGATTFHKKISPKPEPGLWRSEETLLVNGVDLMELARKIEENNMRLASPELRKQMADDDPQLECISEEEALIMTDPKALLARGEPQWADCGLKVQETSERKFSYTGRCYASNGTFLGDLQGEMEIISAREVRGKWSFEGLMESRLGDMTGLVNGDTVSTAVSTWVSADCGDAPARFNPWD